MKYITFILLLLAALTNNIFAQWEFGTGDTIAWGDWKAITSETCPDFPLVHRDLLSIFEMDNISVTVKQKLVESVSFADEAIGVMDKGQLQNLTMNYGQITDTRYEDPGNAPTQFYYNFRYPSTNYTGLCDDFSIFFAIPNNAQNGNNGNVIDGWTDNNNEDWIAKDSSYRATHYNPATDPFPHAEILYPPDNPTIPYLASSDLLATWPVDANGDPFWPGYFRRDPVTGQEFEGEFASDRDLYAVFTDDNNQLGHPIGIEVEMMAYCYSNPYADKIQFYEFFIHNKSGVSLDSCYVGYYKDPDCSDHGEEIIILPDPTFSDPLIPDILLQRDIDGDIGGATIPNANGVLEDYSYGIAIIETPQDIGVTTFHYYTDAGPTDDRILWPIITSNPADPDIISFSSDYFHGTNVNFDDVNLIYNEPKQDLVFIVASGPFTMLPDEVVKSTVVVAVGENDANFYQQINHAIQMFDSSFVYPTNIPTKESSILPKKNNLKQNYPNPFNPKTEIPFNIRKPGNYELIIYNSLGKKIRALGSGKYKMGQYILHWDGKSEKGKSVSSGVYLYQLVGENTVLTKKMILMR